MKKCIVTEGKKPIVMVVEDNTVLSSLIQHLLTREGYKTLSVKDGIEAMECLGEHTPHLILLDLLLPRMDGFEVLKKVKSSLRWKRIPVVVLTNLSQDADRIQCMKLGAAAYIVKASIDRERFASILREYISKAILPESPEEETAPVKKKRAP